MNQGQPSRFEWFVLGVLLALGAMMTLCGRANSCAPAPKPPKEMPAIWEGAPEPFEWGMWGDRWKQRLDLPPKRGRG